MTTTTRGGHRTLSLSLSLVHCPLPYHIRGENRPLDKGGLHIEPILLSHNTFSSLVEAPQELRSALASGCPDQIGT